jgi:hypothetical protein
VKNYHKNPRQIKDKQFANLRAWLLELGDLSGIVHDLNTDEVISGNQRIRAIDIAKCEIVLTEGPHEPDAQGTVAHGYVLWQGAKYNYRQVRWTAEQCEKANIVANKAGGSWDFDVLANEWEKDDLLEWGFELEELGMYPDDDADDEPYSRKIQSPVYEPSGDKPPVKDLFDNAKTLALIAAIQAAEGLTDDERQFLTIAAQRHTVLHFNRIADFYAHSDATTQTLMEDSALVIIDFNRAIELGYVKLSEEIAKLYGEDYPDA